MGNLNFNTDENEPVNFESEALPAGGYEATLESAEVVATKEGNGLLFKGVWLVKQKGFEGRKIFGQLVLNKKTGEKNEIGCGMLSSLCRACGKVGVVEDSSELLNLPHVVRVKLVEATPQFAAKNELQAFYGAEKTTTKVTAKNVEAVSFDEDQVPF